ncbi:stage II sporulation protein M [Iamia majanohamensis]|uniref:Stage II sporulation protein M n=1 Tax=Iamia majanohamensis TaxID=467976 RepID=A0AAE9YA12_9ACTN|nr:stage II sporulation protein M [Iamia majanohamensis]WCO68581.1 stage II sporulation protein M [Iamia majanohamensis]
MTAEQAAPTRRGVDRFIAERTPAWAHLTDLVGRAGPSADRLTPEEVLALGEGYRAAAADLARARQRWPGDPVVAELDALVRRARGLVYRTPGRRGSLRHWLTTGIYVRVREQPGTLLVAALLLWGPMVGLALWAHHDPATATRVAQASPLSRDAAEAAARGGDAGDRGLTTSDSASFATQIFTNNIRVALLCLAGGITGGLATAAVLVYNGGIVGVVVGLFVAGGGGSVALSLLAPHGLLELSLVTVAGAAGLRVGRGLVAPGHRPRGEVLVEEMRAAAEMALGIALWLVPTGLVEGFVTPRGLPPAAAVVVGVLVAAPFWLLVVWRGRAGAGEPPAPPRGQSRAAALASR